ncbi:MAG TPA: DUF3592 domain-containing protein [Methylomirabilota bacterium]|jgi:hypothetical protein
MRIPLRLSSRTFFLLFGAIFLCAGLGLLYDGITTAVREQAYAKRGEVVEAVVIRKSMQRASREGNTSTRYEIVYRFTTPDGPAEGVAVVPVEEWESLEPGRPFKITHLPGTPGSSRAEGAGSMTEAVVVMAAGTLAALLGGIVFGWNARRIWREWRLLREGLAARGTVLAVEPSNVAVNRVRQWQVRYRYEDHVGRSHEGSSGALPPEEAHAIAVGDALTVRFDRHHPEQSVWDRARTPGATTPPWARAIAFARRLGALLLILVVFGAAMIIGEAVPALKDLESLLARHETVLLAVTIGMSAVGFALFMGTIVVRILGGATAAMTATEVEDLSRSVNMEARPAFGRVTRYRFRGRSVGSSFSDAFTFREAKDAWRRRAWRTNPRWRSNFVVMLGVMLLVVGLFSTFIVIGPNGVKLLCAAALAYAAGRTVGGFIRA